MRILWVTQARISISDRLAASGGWTVGALRGLVACGDYEMHYVFLSSEKTDFVEDGIHFWGVTTINGVGYSQQTEEDIYQLVNDLRPDVIHCWGTETSITLSTVNAAERADMINRVVINIQGVQTYISDVFDKTGIPSSSKLGIRPIELATGNSFRSMKKSLAVRLKYEQEAVAKARHIIGRTAIDRTFTEQYAPNATYYLCNETLREAFYSGDKWSVDKMKRNSIFMSEVHYPIKCVEKVFEAVALLADKYSDVELNIAGQDMFCERKLGKNPWDMIPPSLKRDGYQTYLYRLANRLGIRDRIHFVGRLDAEGMKDNYLGANAYVCSSIIENESNSLSEAKLLGTPCVVAFSGGMISRVNDGEDGFFYPWNEPWQLADRLAQIFDNDTLARMFSDNSISQMASIVDRQANLERIREIYSMVADSK